MPANSTPAQCAATETMPAAPMAMKGISSASSPL
jgi:hypothetical protein